MGYDWQSGNWVLGVAADGALSSLSDSDSQVVAGLGTVKSSDDINWFGTARLRSGYALDNVLLYGTGGLALANVNYKVRATGASWSDRYTAAGFAAGFGVEWALNDNWSTKIEYLYYAMGSKKIAGTGAGVGTSTKATPSFQTLSVGVNYRF